MASGENGPLGLNAPYPAPMEPNIEHAPVLDHSMRERIVPETTVKQQTAFQKSVQVILRSTLKKSNVLNNQIFFIYVAGVFSFYSRRCVERMDAVEWLHRVLWLRNQKPFPYMQRSIL